MIFHMDNKKMDRKYDVNNEPIIRRHDFYQD